ncbi:hypothetical protein [Brevibacillus reuszeri]|uniref:hypothetical protein n=1 Tax=Brevibacillus reuszeri TaxID=54915 RepID=UPI000CCBECB2|nr:hypothetical protein [Brevibacillus reuszeri]
MDEKLKKNIGTFFIHVIALYLAFVILAWGCQFLLSSRAFGNFMCGGGFESPLCSAFEHVQAGGNVGLLDLLLSSWGGVYPFLLLFGPFLLPIWLFLLWSSLKSVTNDDYKSEKEPT